MKHSESTETSMKRQEKGVIGYFTPPMHLLPLIAKNYQNSKTVPMQDPLERLEEEQIFHALAPLTLFEYQGTVAACQCEGQLHRRPWILW